MAKAGVIALARSLAQATADDGITANAVCPGFTDTSIADEAVRNIARRTGATAEEARRRLAAMSPQQRLVEPDEVASLVAFLTTDHSASINGQAIGIDGGVVTS
mgnify:CR=1 FL=1